MTSTRAAVGVGYVAMDPGRGYVRALHDYTPAPLSANIATACLTPATSASTSLSSL
jgi:hypothetical protein